MSQAMQQFLKKMPEPIRKDPKKAMTLAVLLVIGAGIGAKQFIGSGPSRVSASGREAEVETTDIDPLADTRPIRVAKSENLERWLSETVVAPTRNLFAVKTEFFPRQGTKHQDAVRNDLNESFWDRLEKSIVSRADQRRQKQIRQENLLTAAGQLKLHSTLMGSHPRALIEGRLVRVGDTVMAGGVSFKVVAIEARRMLVERDGVRVEVPMGQNKTRPVSK
jgi:hypothetical protein